MWEKFQLHEQTVIVQQSNHPDFAQLRNRVQEGQQTNDGVIQVKDLTNINTATWPDEMAKARQNSYVAEQENEYCTVKLDSEVNVSKV